MALFYGGLLAFALGLVLVGSHIGITLVADRILGREFAAESRVFENVREMRYDQMQHGAALLAADYGFRGAVATGDAPTIGSALDSLRQRLGIDRALMVSTAGTVVGFDDHDRAADRGYLVAAVTGGATRGVLQLDGVNYRAVATPVKAPDTVGWVVFLDALDRREMTRMAQLSAIPLRAELLPIDRVSKDIPIVKAGSARSAERRIGGQRLLEQASIVPDFGNRRPQVLVLQYSLTDALTAYAPMFRILLASCALALAIAIAGSLYLARRLARPIEALDRAAQRVGRGEFAQVEITTHDEIGRLTAAFNTMVHDIEDRERQVAQAQARLEQRIAEVQAENARLDAIATRQRNAAMAEAATALDVELAPLLRAFDAEAGRLFVAARDMRASLDDAKTRASDAGRSALRSEGMTQDIAGNADDLARSGERIAVEAGSTLGLVRRAADDSVAATASFVGLRNAVDEIGSVTGAIRSISDRTNMLALNAAIEAARAGAAGRSFAVVAAEVKDLAKQTAELTIAIGKRLAQIDQASSDADATMGQVRDTLAAAGDVTEMIASAARSQYEATGNISHGISDIAHDSRAAVTAIDHINRAADASVRMADQVQASAESVTTRASVLRATLDTFLSSLRRPPGG